MQQPPQGVMEIINPWDLRICFRVSAANRFHQERFGSIAVPVRDGRIILPPSASPLLRNLVEVLSRFASDIDGDLPLTPQLLRVELCCPDHRLEIIKGGQTACRLSGMRDTIRDRASVRTAA